jgi:NAD(P)-dependent dehydrogenase (short-subunit alcohol dehydrogenase family)
MAILITGANRGIGRGLLTHYRTAGADVLGTARDGSQGLLALDVTDPQAQMQLALQIPSPLHLLICNAGIFPANGDALDSGFAPQDWAAGFAINVTGVFLTIQALLPQLRAGRQLYLPRLQGRRAEPWPQSGRGFARRWGACRHLSSRLGSDRHGRRRGRYHRDAIGAGSGGAVCGAVAGHNRLL